MTKMAALRSLEPLTVKFFCTRVLSKSHFVLLCLLLISIGDLISCNEPHIYKRMQMSKPITHPNTHPHLNILHATRCLQVQTQGIAARESKVVSSIKD
jgi:hypothetical protein